MMNQAARSARSETFERTALRIGRRCERAHRLWIPHDVESSGVRMM
jgi:hypothetical protein